jgi:hypothetical protein
MLRSGRRVREVQLTTDELAMREAQRETQEEVKRRKVQNERAHRRHQQTQARALAR